MKRKHDQGKATSAPVNLRLALDVQERECRGDCMHQRRRRLLLSSFLLFYLSFKMESVNSLTDNRVGEFSSRINVVEQQSPSPLQVIAERSTGALNEKSFSHPSLSKQRVAPQNEVLLTFHGKKKHHSHDQKRKKSNNTLRAAANINARQNHKPPLGPSEAPP